MTDFVADASELESSAASLNYQSWLPPAADKDRGGSSSSPLLRNKKLGRGLSPSYPGVREGTQTSQSKAAVYRELLESQQDGKEPFVSQPRCCEMRSCRRLGWVEWLFVVMATISMAGTLGMSVERFSYLQRSFDNMTPDESFFSGWAEDDGGGGGKGYCDSWVCLNDFIFAAIVLINLVFAVYYCYDGLLRERPFEVIGFAITVFILTLYVLINYLLEGEQDDITKLVRLVLVCVFGPQNIVLALVVQYRMGFLVLHTVGTKRHLTRAYHVRSLLLTLQTFNVQLLANVLVLTWSRQGKFTSLGEKILLPLLLVYVIVTSYLGWIAVVWEKRKMVLVWNLLLVVCLGYYVFKIVNVGVHWSYYREVFTDYYVRGESPGHTHFLYIAIVLLFTCGLGFLSCIAMVILMLMAVRNFDLGLKERVPPPCCSTVNYVPGVSEP